MALACPGVLREQHRPRSPFGTLLRREHNASVAPRSTDQHKENGATAG